MGYTVKDLPYYVGFFTATIAVYLALAEFGVESQLVRTIAAMLTGAGVGWLTERLVVGDRKGGPGAGGGEAS